ncbi:MAG: DUF4411 family protein [Chloroflexi bacterium]|nr:DUF4411 family protein [Chloroflexota bacterium]
MPDFWLDADSLIQPKRGPYGFDIAPGFWTFLEQNARRGSIASSLMVYHELQDGAEDDLLAWARQRKGEGFFVDPDPLVQNFFRQIADYVEKNYPPHQASEFLDGVDPWVIAHAKVYGGKVVTFEVRAPKSSKPKIPDICDKFDVECLNIYNMVRELGMSLGQ